MGDIKGLVECSYKQKKRERKQKFNSLSQDINVEAISVKEKDSVIKAEKFDPIENLEDCENYKHENSANEEKKPVIDQVAPLPAVKPNVKSWAEYPYKQKQRERKQKFDLGHDKNIEAGSVKEKDSVNKAEEFDPMEYLEDG